MNLALAPNVRIELFNPLSVSNLFPEKLPKSKNLSPATRPTEPCFTCSPPGLGQEKSWSDCLAGPMATCQYISHHTFQHNYRQYCKFQIGTQSPHRVSPKTSKRKDCSMSIPDTNPEFPSIFDILGTMQVRCKVSLNTINTKSWDRPRNAPSKAKKDEYDTIIIKLTGERAFDTNSARYDDRLKIKQ